MNLFSLVSSACRLFYILDGHVPEPKLDRVIQNATSNRRHWRHDADVDKLHPPASFFRFFVFPQCPLEFMVSKRARGGAGEREENGKRAPS